jgi:energy-coupling factor transporter transmembrane protein EcfT
MEKFGCFVIAALFLCLWVFVYSLIGWKKTLIVMGVGTVLAVLIIVISGRGDPKKFQSC